MYYSDALGRWVRGRDVTLAASAQRAATGTGAAIELGDATTGRLTLEVTAGGVDADEVLDVTVEASGDGVTWRQVGAFAQAAGATTERASFSGLDRFVRAAWTVAGTTPDFTFSVTGEVL
jgi:hypothetical protein